MVPAFFFARANPTRISTRKNGTPQVTAVIADRCNSMATQASANELKELFAK